MQEAIRAGQPYVNKRWLGGMLTNFVTIKKRIGLLDQLEARQLAGDFDRLPKKEAAQLTEELNKLQATLGGIRKMKRLPGAIFIVDPHRERIAVTEANKLEIPVVGTGDTNVDPDELDYIIPANDDAIRAIRLLCQLVADAAIEGAQRARGARRGRARGAEAAGGRRARVRRGRRGRPGRPARRRRHAVVRPRARRRGPPARRAAGRRGRRRRRRPRRPPRRPPPRTRPRDRPGRPATPTPARRRRDHDEPTRARRARAPHARHRSTTPHGRSRPRPSRSCASGPAPGMMDCKRALEETGGDIDKAVALLRERGLRRPPRRPAATPARASSAATSTPAAASAC